MFSDEFSHFQLRQQQYQKQRVTEAEQSALAVEALRQRLLERYQNPGIWNSLLGAALGLATAKLVSPATEVFSKTIARSLSKTFPKIAGETISDVLINQVERATKRSALTEFARDLAKSRFRHALNPLSYIVANQVVGTLHPGQRYTPIMHLQQSAGVIGLASFSQPLIGQAYKFQPGLFERLPLDYFEAQRTVVENETAYLKSVYRALKEEHGIFGAVLTQQQRWLKERKGNIFESFYGELKGIARVRRLRYSNYRQILQARPIFEKFGEFVPESQLTKVEKEYLQRLPKEHQTAYKKFLLGLHSRHGKQILAEFLQSLPKPQESFIAKAAQLERATFADIETEIGEILRYHIKRLGFKPEEIPLGEGFYKVGNQVRFIPTFRQRVIEGLVTAERNFVIPYLEFNPVSFFKPGLWREYLYGYRVPKLLSRRTPLPLPEGLKSVQALLSEKNIKEGIAFTVGESVYLFGRRAGTTVLEKLNIPPARFVSRFEMSGTMLRAFGEATETFIKGEWEYDKQAQKWIPKAKPFPKYEGTVLEHFFIPKWSRATSSTFWGRLMETAKAPFTYFKTRKQITEALKSEKRLQILAKYRQYIPEFEEPFHVQITKGTSTQMNEFLVKIFKKIRALEKQELIEPSGFERIAETMLTSSKYSQDLSAVVGKSGMRVYNIAARQVGFWSTLGAALEDFSSEELKQMPKEFREIAYAAKRIYKQIKPDLQKIFSDLEQFKQLPIVKEMKGLVKGSAAPTFAKYILGAHPLEYFARLRQGSTPRMSKLATGIPGIGQEMKEEFSTVFEYSTYLPFFRPWAAEGEVPKIPGFLKKGFRWLSPDKYQGGTANIYSTFLHWMFERPIELAEYVGLGGIKYEKVHGFQQVTKRLFKDIVLPLTSIQGGAFLIDQLIDQLTPGENNSPLGWMIKGVQDLYVGLTQIANVTGIGPLMRRLNELYPGLIPTLQGAYGMVGGGIIPAITFQSVQAMQSQVPTTREQVLRVEGVENVPVKEGFGWEFGKTPYLGGRTFYYRPSLLYLEGTGYEWTPQMFGSKLKYFFLGGRPPSIFNLFGLTSLANPYYYQEKLGQGPMGAGRPAWTEIPFYGLIGIGYPQIGASLQAMSLIYSSQQLNISIQQNITQLQIDQQIEEQMKAQQHQLLRSGVTFYSLSYLKEYLGMIGFMSSQLAPRGTFKTPTQQVANYQSIERLYYQLNIGNIFGLTEFFRRAYPNNNQMYTSPYLNLETVTKYPWLPRRFFFGDMYLSTEMGQVRLPGPTFAYTRGLIDQYGPVDILRILSGVQPSSMQYRIVRQYIEQHKEKYSLVERYLITTQEEEAQQTGKYPTKRRAFSISFTTQQVQLEKYLGQGRFTTKQGLIVQFYGVQTDVDKLARRIYQQRNITIEQQYYQAHKIQSQLESKFKQLEHSTVSLRVPKDIGLRYKYISPNEIILRAMPPFKPSEVPKPAIETSHWIAERWRYGTNIFRRWWESFAHQFGFWHEKFIPLRTPLEEYERYFVFGTYSSQWQHPIKTLLLPSIYNTLQQPFFEGVGHIFWLSSLATINPAAGLVLTSAALPFYTIGKLINQVHPLIPRDEEKIRELEQEYEQLRYLKGQRSIVNLHNLTDVQRMQQVLPRRERQFFQQFVTASKEERRRIEEIAPDWMVQLLQSIWSYTEEYVAGGIPSRQVQIQSQDIANQLIMQQDQNAEQIQYLDPDKYYSLRAQVDIGDLRKQGTSQWYAQQAQANLFDTSFLENNYYSSARYITKQILTLNDYQNNVGQSNYRFSVSAAPNDVTVQVGQYQGR